MKNQWVIGDSLENSEHGFPPTPAGVAYAAGSAADQANASILACDTMMTQNYQINHVAIGANIYPFLYSDFTPGGGRYTLYINPASAISEQPTPPLYGQLKSVSHVPLGVWTIIARYAQYPQHGAWIQPLTDFGMAISKALAGLPILDLPTEVAEHMSNVLTTMHGFIKQALDKNTFDIEDYSKAAMAVGKDLICMQELAAKTQVDAFTKTLGNWKTMIGQQAWDNLYAVISAQWTLSTENVHQLIISSTMSEAQAAQNIFVTSMPLSGIDEARALCGRIVGDRIMAYQTLSTDTERGRENIYSLSTSRDLISKAAEDVISGKTTTCPHLAARKH